MDTADVNQNSVVLSEKSVLFAHEYFRRSRTMNIFQLLFEFSIVLCMLKVNIKLHVKYQSSIFIFLTYKNYIFTYNCNVYYVMNSLL